MPQRGAATRHGIEKPVNLESVSGEMHSNIMTSLGSWIQQIVVIHIRLPVPWLARGRRPSLKSHSAR
jgi:hypothetical protein